MHTDLQLCNTLTLPLHKVIAVGILGDIMIQGMILGLVLDVMGPVLDSLVIRLFSNNS